MFANSNQRIRITHTVPNIQFYEKFQSVAVLSMCFCHSTELKINYKVKKKQIFKWSLSPHEGVC